MKTRRTTTAAVTVLIMVLALTAAVNAQYRNTARMNFTGNEIVNLNNAIKSDNEGLKKSAIYMAGKYRVNDAVEALTDAMHNEKDPAVRMLITRALFEIGNRDGMKAVYELSKADDNAKVRKISRALYDVYIDTDYEAFTIVK